MFSALLGFTSASFNFFFVVFKVEKVKNRSFILFCVPPLLIRYGKRQERAKRTWSSSWGYRESIREWKTKEEKRKEKGGNRSVFLFLFGKKTVHLIYSPVQGLSFVSSSFSSFFSRLSSSLSCPIWAPYTISLIQSATRSLVRRPFYRRKKTLFALGQRVAFSSSLPNVYRSLFLLGVVVVLVFSSFNSPPYETERERESLPKMLADMIKLQMAVVNEGTSAKDGRKTGFLFTKKSTREREREKGERNIHIRAKVI